LFARLHPQQRFPATSVLAIGVLSGFFCLLPLETLLKGISGVSALTQFIPQAIALVVIRQYRQHVALPFKMWGYPIPVAIALAGWLFVLLANEGWILLTATAISLLGVVFYLWRERATLKNAVDAEQ